MPAPTRAMVTPVRTTMPSRSSGVEHDRGAFGIVAGQRLAASSTVTSAPSRRNACASSRPMEPAPITMRWRGQSARSNTVVAGQVRRGRKAGNGRQRRREPVAMTKRRAAMVVAGDRDGARIRKPRGAFDQLHAEAGEPLRVRVRRAAPRSRRARGPCTAAKSIPDRAGLEPEPRALRPCHWRAGGASAAEGRGRRRCRHCPAADRGALLDQHDRHAEGSRRRWPRQAAGAGADDADVGFNDRWCSSPHRPFTRCRWQILAAKSYGVS